MEYPKVLIISHNALSETTNNGKTMASFFDGWHEDKLAQFYIYSEIPTSTVCTNYFRITDTDILRANLSFSKATGMLFDKSTKNQCIIIEADNYQSKNMKKTPIKELAREFVWRKTKWHSDSFINWLDKFNPQIIFFQGSNHAFLYKLVLWIQKKYSSKLYIQLTDDYTYVRSLNSPISWINHFLYMKLFKQGLHCANKVYAISPAMIEEYKHKYKIKNIDILANCVTERNIKNEKIGKSIRFIYAGSVHTNRWKVLELLGSCLKQLDSEGYHAILDIYCPIKPEEKILNRLNINHIMKYKGTLNQEQLQEEITLSNVLVYIEAFDKKSIKVTRLSLSTKIPEYMVSGRCILAIGPKDISSIKYLESVKSAFLIKSLHYLELKKQLIEIITNKSLRYEIAQNALQEGINMFHIDNIKNKLHDELLNSK